MMQVMGVYRNCLCQINVNACRHGRSKANLKLSTNSAEDIEQALKYWIPTGGAASSFLGSVTYVAWWYQRRQRFRFTELVGRLDDKFPLNVPEQAFFVKTQVWQAAYLSHCFELIFSATSGKFSGN